ncbi:MAG: hypothetical protein ACHQ49_07880 [Elusimicrobiota bacterium]
MRSARLLVVALCLAAAPSTSWAYAESGGVFDVGFAALPPTRPGGVVSLEYDSLDQGKDWSGARRASYAANPDKDIGTEFFTGAIRYMVDPSWGFEISAPVARRHLVTTDEHGVVGGADNGAIGDIRARGVYSGFSPGMSSGLTFGLKLPTGPFRTPDFARDSQIGAGGTDLLLGAYHKGRIATGGAWSWFSNGAWDEPLLDSGGYRPGAEIDAALGAAYDGWSVGGLRVAPFAQAVGTLRWRDLGTSADPADSGYRRVLLSPGLEVSMGAFRASGDADFPVYQFVDGNQLVASELYRLSVGWSF